MIRNLIFYILFFDAIVFAVILLYFQYPLYLAVLPFLLFLMFIAVFVANIQLNMFVTSIHKGKTDKHEIALTFDDGPHPIYTPIVLDVLKKHNAKASFFLIGKNAEQFPYLVDRILDEGHTIGNHSFHHENTIGFKRTAGWQKEINSTNQILEKYTGKSPRFFRPPFGITTPHLASALKKTQMVSIGWSDRTFDTSQKDIQKINQKLEKKVKAGSIILLHDTHERIQPLLEQLLPKLARKNFSFVTVNELINEEPYVEI